MILSGKGLQNHHDILGAIVGVAHVHPASRELADGGANDMQGVEIVPCETSRRKRAGKQMWQGEERTRSLMTLQR